MDNKNKQCFRCEYYNYYFIKGKKRFNKIKLGRCGKKCDTVNMHDSCGGFVLRRKRQTHKLFLEIYLEHLLTEISELRLLMEEEINENKNL